MDPDKPKRVQKCNKAAKKKTVSIVFTMKDFCTKSLRCSHVSRDFLFALEERHTCRMDGLALSQCIQHGKKVK